MPDINPFIGFLANRGGYSVDAIYAIPHLADDINSIRSQSEFPAARNVNQAAGALAQALKDPVTYIKNRLNQDVFNGARTGNYSDFDKSIAFLRTKNLPETEIQSAVDSSVNYANSIPQPGQGNSFLDRAGRAFAKIDDVIVRPVVAPVSAALAKVDDKIIQPITQPVSQALAKVEDVVKEEILAKPAGQILLMVAMPYAASAIAPYLAAALPASLSAAQVMAISTAVTQTTIAIASGVPPEKALEAAIINSTINVGAGELRPYIDDVVQNKYITNAVTNAAATVTRVAVSGGNQDQIESALSNSFLTSSTQMLNFVPGYSELSIPAKNTLAASLLAAAKDKPVDAAAASALFSSGVQAAANGVVVNNIIKEKLGRDATADEITDLALYTPSGQINKVANAYVNKRIVDPQEVQDAFASEGRTNLTPQEIERFVKKDVDETSILSEAKQEADKTATTAEELKDLFNRVMERDPSQDEITKFTGEKTESQTLSEAEQYIQDYIKAASANANLPKDDPSLNEVKVVASREDDDQSYIDYMDDFYRSIGLDPESIPKASPMTSDPLEIYNEQFLNDPSLNQVNVVAKREEDDSTLDLAEADPSLNQVNVVAKREEDYPSLDLVNVVASREEDDPSLDLVNVVASREEDDPSLDEVKVVASREEDDPLDYLSPDPIKYAKSNSQIFNSSIPSSSTIPNFNTIGVPAFAIRAMLDENENPIPQSALEDSTFNWNSQQVQDPEDAAAYGQAQLNPTYDAAHGGLMSLARGGIATLGGYSDGGRLLKGPGDGMSDNIPAMIGAKQPARLADGEFVIPADVVSHLGNGSTEAGANVLYKMMNKVRRARTGNPKQGKQINPKKFIPS